MTVLMPNTGEIDPGGAPFTGYSLSRAGAVEPLPTGMTPVTGSPRAWAFMLDQLEWAPWTVIDVAAYEAPFATRGPDRLSHYLKGSHGRACAARLHDEDGHSPVLKTVDVIGRLVKPYAVFMTR